jgi:hypothetical protein
MLLDPYGRLVTSQKRELVTGNPQIAKFVSMAETPFQALDLTVVCRSCGQTPKMGNAPSDVDWLMECACTKRVLRNPAKN